MFPGRELERMRDLLSNNDIVADSSSLDKSLLRGVNIIWQVGFEPISNAFCNDFINYITEAYGSEISGNRRNQLFWDKSNVRVICLAGKNGIAEEVGD
jgi:hypothetical protein